MKLHCISDLEYNTLVFNLVFRNTDFSSTLSLSPHAVPSIGYGFNLQDERLLTPVLASLGFDVSGKHLQGHALEAERHYIESIRRAFQTSTSTDAESLNNQVQCILAARLLDKRYPRCHRYKRIARFVFEDKSAVKASLKAILKNFEKTVDRWLMAFDVDIANRNPQLFARKSLERAVLVSLAYQGTIGIKPNKTPSFPALGNAFLLDNRPLAWYYIRYNALDNKQSPETVRQRYYESELFGLYDEGIETENVTSEQRREIYTLYTEYKDHIGEHERLYSHEITLANQQFGLTGNKVIKTLEQNLALAFRYIGSAEKVHVLPPPDTSANPFQQDEQATRAAYKRIALA